MTNKSKDENSQGTDYIHIPLKDPNKDLELNENLDDFKEHLTKTVKNISDETEKMTDDLMEETEDVIVNKKIEIENKLLETIKTQLNDEETMENKTPTHSIDDSLKTNSPEPEIEKALSSDEKKSPPSPKPTLMEFKNINLDENN